MDLPDPYISTVITTYNRSALAQRAIRSALKMVPQGEVVLVDDASTDDTLEAVQREFTLEITNGTLILVALDRNCGVTGAKNAGYAKARGRWVVFLDSDDEYLLGTSQDFISQLKKSEKYSIVFFRCETQCGEFVGIPISDGCELDLRQYVRHTSFGEALTVINRRQVGNDAPYVMALRGYEGLGCCRIIRDHGAAWLSAVIARVYYVGGDDALSASKGFVRRMPLLARGHLRMISEFRHVMTCRQVAWYLIKALVYWFIGTLYRAVSK